MKKLMLTLFVSLLSFAHADTISVEGAHSYLFGVKGNMVTSSACPKYLNVHQLSLEQVRAKCHELIGERTQEHFYEVLNAQSSKFYDGNSIMSSEQLSHKEKLIADLLEYDQTYGLDPEGLKKLEMLQTSVTKHYLNDRLKYEFEIHLKDTLNSIGSDTLEILTGNDNILKGLKISQDTLICGIEGSLEQRIADCSQYSSLNVEGFSYVIADFVTRHFLVVSDNSEYYSNYLSKELLEYSNGRPWRRISEIEQSTMPSTISKHVYYTSALMNTNLKFSNTLKRRGSNDRVEMNLENGLLSITLYENGEAEVIKQLNMPQLPVEMKYDVKRAHFDRYKYVKAVAEGQVDFNDGLVESLNMGYIFLFPIPLAAHAIYSTAYIPAFVMDIFSRDHRLYRKFKKLVNGKKVSAGKKDFERLTQIMRRL